MLEAEASYTYRIIAIHFVITAKQNIHQMCVYNSSRPSFIHTNVSRLLNMMDAVVTTLKAAYDEFPEAVNSNTNRDILKKGLVSNGASAILGMCGTHNAQIAYGCAAALMYIDSYTPSCPVPSGNLDQRDAKMLMTNVDILNGCNRSLVKFFFNQIPCNCLDESYAKVKSTIPKEGMCANCKQMKDRNNMYICTGCERVQYCSEACQLLDVSRHKSVCRRWQRYDKCQQGIYGGGIERLYN